MPLRPMAEDCHSASWGRGGRTVNPLADLCDCGQKFTDDESSKRGVRILATVWIQAGTYLEMGTVSVDKSVIDGSWASGRGRLPLPLWWRVESADIVVIASNNKAKPSRLAMSLETGL